MDNPNILDLHYPVLIEIQKILENRSTMMTLLEVLPPDCSSEDVLTAMEVESRRYNMTPARILLNILGAKDYRVSNLVEWFTAIGLEKALILLRSEEPLEIVTHPPIEVRVVRGSELSLTCSAVSYPPPEYQWFKDDEEVLLQIDPVLSIKSVSLSDAGMYTCLVTKWNARKNTYEWLYSDFSNVEVIPSDLHAPREPHLSSLKTIPEEHSCFSSPLFHKDNEVTSLCQKNCVSQSESIRSHPTSKQAKQGDITITKHPYVVGKVAQGMSICLSCEAVSASHSVSFQWFRNRRPLQGETSSRLILNDLYPDLETGEMRWDYQCEAYNECDRALSEMAVVELDETNNTTPYIAHQKYAFMVANDTYDHLEHLKKPAADVKDVANLLSSLGFKIFAFRNLTLTEMRNAFSFFRQTLKRGCYALFFFAGHGFELYGQTYLQPVDTSDGSMMVESMCSEYILQCMQDRGPNVNILLIDACRKLPLNFSASSKSNCPVLPGRIFKAKMKNNTIYGYSTSFLCASHESDEESNSVFVKHLKKYITHDRCIQDVLMMVQRDFARDPIARNIQFPVIKSTLAENRKLSDPVKECPASLPQSCLVDWCDLKREKVTKSTEISILKASIVIELDHHMEVFCNAMDAHVYLHLQPNAEIFILHDMEINVSFTSPELQVTPVEGVALKNVDMLVGRRTLLFKKEIFNLQKLKDRSLKCGISLTFRSKNVTKTMDCDFDVVKISELQLSLNNMEDPLLYTVRNSFK